MTSSRPSPIEGRFLTGLYLFAGAFQAALAAGAPWGRLAWGGSREGRLPAGLRVGSAVSVGVYAALADQVRREQSLQRRRILTVGATLMSLSVVANLASHSLVERVVWTPIATAMAVLSWRNR